jgi:L-serine deaminase
MQHSIHEGLTTSGILPGGLEVERKAQYLFNQRHIDESPVTRENRIVCSYAYAASEQNADNGTIVTAPTCGACAVVPSVLKYMQENLDIQMFKAKDIAEGIGISSRTVSGAMRKLTTDGFVEKLGQDPVIYAITEEGKNITIN